VLSGLFLRGAGRRRDGRGGGQAAGAKMREGGERGRKREEKRGPGGESEKWTIQAT